MGLAQTADIADGLWNSGRTCGRPNNAGVVVSAPYRPIGGLVQSAGDAVVGVHSPDAVDQAELVPACGSLTDVVQRWIELRQQDTVERIGETMTAGPGPNSATSSRDADRSRGRSAACRPWPGRPPLHRPPVRSRPRVAGGWRSPPSDAWWPADRPVGLHRRCRPRLTADRSARAAVPPR